MKKNILITGASRGLGYELAMKAASVKGNRVIAVARNSGLLQQIPVHTDSEIIPFSTDLGSETDVQLLVKQVRDFGWLLDGMILNAGVFEKTDVRHATWSELDRLMRVNCYASFTLCGSLSDSVVRGGHIVLLSSMGGFQGSRKFPGNTAYCMSKGALSIMGECMAAELKNKEISVNVVCPGAIRTDMLKQAFPEYAGGVSAKALSDWLWDYFEKGRAIFNGTIVPVCTSDL